MQISEHDARCNELFRQLNTLKAQGADKIKGGEYDAVLRALQTAARERLSSIQVMVL